MADIEKEKAAQARIVVRDVEAEQERDIASGYQDVDNAV